MQPDNIGRRRQVGGDFDLVDFDAHPVTAQTFHGGFALYFFGFTHCGMVCPRALGRLSRVLDRLGPIADRVQPLYVTVDPERDTPEVMKKFLANDYPRFIGLTGSSDQIDTAKRAFRVFAARKADPLDPDGYQMPHSAFTYLMDPAGELAAHFTDAVDEDELEERLEVALRAEQIL